MPFRSKEAKRAYQRRWYAAHREQVIAEVAERKRTLYGGVCRNCGKATMGETKGKSPEWCNAPVCRSVQFQLRKAEFAGYVVSKQPLAATNITWKHDPAEVQWEHRFRVFCACGWASEWDESSLNVWTQHAGHTKLVERQRRPDAR